MKTILKFEKDNCMPCVQVSTFLDTHKIKYDTINPFDEPELALKYNIRSVPTTLLIEGEQIVSRVIGFKPEELISMVK